jgi:HPt (histidine-containing phosphotransfer) domain-containing protein
MPEMDGYEVTRIIRTNEKVAAQSGQERTRICIIALTANALMGDREKCLAAGMDDYVAKPFTINQIQKVISRWLGVNCKTADNKSGISDSDSAFNTDSHISEEGQNHSTKLNLSVIDQNFLNELSALHKPGKRDIRGDVIDKFLESFPARLENLGEAIITNDIENMKIISHALKSNCAMLGATALAELFQQIEQLDVGKTADGAAELFEKIRHDFVDVKNALSYLKTNTNGPSS